GGGPFEYEGETWSASVPGLSDTAESPRDVPPVYVAATAPKMQALAGELAEGCLTPSITTPAFVRYTRGNVGPEIDVGCTVVASIGRDRDEGRDGAREIAAMYLANKVQNIKGAADTLLELAGLEQDEIRPVAEAMERGGRLAAKAEVTDAILDKCRPIAGTPGDCIAAIEEYRDAGCTHVMLELWGDRPHEQVSWRASYSTTVRLRDPEVAARLLREAVEQVAARVLGGPSWRVRADDPARLEACRLAAADAERRATVFAEALGLRRAE